MMKVNVQLFTEPPLGGVPVVQLLMPGGQTVVNAQKSVQRQLRQTINNSDYELVWPETPVCRHAMFSTALCPPNRSRWGTPVEVCQWKGKPSSVAHTSTLPWFGPSPFERKHLMPPANET